MLDFCSELLYLIHYIATLLSHAHMAEKLFLSFHKHWSTRRFVMEPDKVIEGTGFVSTVKSRKADICHAINHFTGSHCNIDIFQSDTLVACFLKKKRNAGLGQAIRMRLLYF